MVPFVISALRTSVNKQRTFQDEPWWITGSGLVNPLWAGYSCAQVHH